MFISSNFHFHVLIKKKILFLWRPHFSLVYKLYFSVYALCVQGLGDGGLMVGNGLWYRTIRTSSPSHTDHQNNNKKLKVINWYIILYWLVIHCFVFSNLCKALMLRIAQLIQASGAGDGKNVKNASLCGIDQMPWIHIAVSHMKTICCR